MFSSFALNFPFAEEHIYRSIQLYFFYILSVLCRVTGVPAAYPQPIQPGKLASLSQGHTQADTHIHSWETILESLIKFWCMYGQKM